MAINNQRRSVRFLLAVAVGCGCFGERSDLQESGEAERPIADFSTAIRVNAKENPTLSGRLRRGGDVDVYALGPMPEGARVEIDFFRDGSLLRPVIALFHEHGDVIFDRADPYLLGRGSDLPGMFSVMMPSPSEETYLAVSQRWEDRIDDRYRLELRTSIPTATPASAALHRPPKSQTIALNFTGSAAHIPGFGEVFVQPFSGREIAEVYADATKEIQDSILATFQENFAGYQVFVLHGATEHGQRSDVSTIHIGSDHPFAFGASGSVDLLNEDACDDGIVFAESFTPSVFGRVLTAKELGVALGNVAAHEAGHLLGLRHVRNPSDLMDESSSTTYLLENQKFLRSPLAFSVFPIGWQDGDAILARTLGRSPLISEESTLP